MIPVRGPTQHSMMSMFRVVKHCAAPHYDLVPVFIQPYPFCVARKIKRRKIAQDQQLPFS